MNAELASTGGAAGIGAVVLVGPTTLSDLHVEFVKDPSSAAERTEVLVAAAELITAHTDPDRRDLLLAAAATLASIVLPRRTITSALKEAAMPVPVRDTPLGRELYQEGRKEGRTEGRQEGRQEGEEQAVLRMTAAMLRRRFGADDARVPAAAARLAALPDDDRIALILGASSLDDLLT